MGLSIRPYKPREGLEVVLLVASESNQETLQRLVRASYDSISRRRYTLAILEGAQRDDGGANAIIELDVADSVMDPFIHPISPEAFRIFEKLPEYSEITLDRIAARYIRALLYALHLEESPDHIYLLHQKIFNGHPDKDLNVAKIISNLAERRQQLDRQTLNEVSMTDLYKIMRLVKETTEQRIALNLLNSSGNVLIYCGKGYKQSVERCIDAVTKSNGF